jgi:integrase
VKRGSKPGSDPEQGTADMTEPEPLQLTYDVRVWGIRKIPAAQGKMKHQVRWIVAGKVRYQTFDGSALANGHQAKLRTAANEGQPFDIDTGLPLSMVPKEKEAEAQEDLGPTWYEFAVAYSDVKWKQSAPGSRRGIAQALATVTLATLPAEGNHLGREEVHAALATWAFSVTARDAGLREDLADKIQWVEENSPVLSDLGDPDVLRGILARLGLRLDGQPVKASTYNRKRATLFNALSYAVEKKHFTFNPLLAVTWTGPKNTEAIDRRRVVSELLGRKLVVAVGHQGAMGQHLKAFFGCLFLAGIRPAEAIALKLDELELPDSDDEWGWLHLEDSSPQTSGIWTDSGEREIRQLKHRAERETRPVPVCPPLVRLIRWHIAAFGIAADGRLFRAENGDLLSESTYNTVHQKARREVLTPAQVKSVLAERPYDLRHARLSIWLNAGITPPQVSEWAGNSVPVLLRTYAKCLVDSTDASLEKLGRKKPNSDKDQEQEDLDLLKGEEEMEVADMTWFELATGYLGEKWGMVRPTTRKGITETLTKVTMALLPSDAPWPTQVQLGTALTSWAFNRNRWDAIPAEQAEVIAWVEERSPMTSVLRDPDRLGAVRAYLGLRLDGEPASESVTARRRSTLFNVLEHAVRQRLLPSNPLLFRSWDGWDSQPPLNHKQP